jgi:hypothetical protein
MKSTILIASLCWLWAGQAHADTVVYERQRELLVHAIQHGHAEGIVAGALAEQFAQQFGQGELLARADIVQHYTRQDCKRLLLVLTHRSALAGRPPEISLRIQLNYCLAGAPPALLEALP